MEIDLTNFELFKSFSEFEKGGIYVDLHNDFDCKTIEYSQVQKQFTLSFKPNVYCTQNVKNIDVIFEDCCIQSYSAKLEGANGDLGTIDVMYRGRFELSSEQLSETLNGRYYYYINFLPDRNFELFSKRVIAVFE